MTDYEIGYGKPPRNGRFKPGVSGNAKGRPKRGPLVADEIISRVLNAPMKYHDRGRAKIATRQELVTQTAGRPRGGRRYCRRQKTCSSFALTPSALATQGSSGSRSATGYRITPQWQTDAQPEDERAGCCLIRRCRRWNALPSGARYECALADARNQRLRRRSAHSRHGSIRL